MSGHTVRLNASFLDSALSLTDQPQPRDSPCPPQGMLRTGFCWLPDFLPDHQITTNFVRCIPPSLCPSALRFGVGKPVTSAGETHKGRGPLRWADWQGPEAGPAEEGQDVGIPWLCLPVKLTMPWGGGAGWGLSFVFEVCWQVPSHGGGSTHCGFAPYLPKKMTFKSIAP